MPDGAPYVTVGVDARGSACWVVVAPGVRVECPSGSRALEVLQAVCRTQVLPVPQ